MHEPKRLRDSWGTRGTDKWYSEGRMDTKTNRWDNRLWRRLVSKNLANQIFKPFAWAESFFANLPLTIGAISLSAATLGVDWFKFAEENMDSCQRVHFHSAQCTFPEVRVEYLTHYCRNPFAILTHSLSQMILVPWLFLLRYLRQDVQSC